MDFFGLLAAFFEQEGRLLASCGVLPSLHSDLLMVFSGRPVVSWGVLPSLPSDVMLVVSSGFCSSAGEAIEFVVRKYIIGPSHNQLQKMLETVPYLGLKDLSMILCLRSSPLPLSNLEAIQC